jgi:hypothetical protein
MGANANADDDAGLPVCCANQASTTFVQLFLSMCLLSVMLQPKIEPVTQNPFIYL